jgi:hypothetical protein
LTKLDPDPRRMTLTPTPNPTPNPDPNPNPNTNQARLVDASARTVAALRAVPCFKELAEAELEKIVAAGAGRWLPRYTKLFREGAAANAFFVLLKVRVE